MSAVVGAGARTLRIGTRASALALVQARLVVDDLAAIGVTAQCTTIVTDGDMRSADTAWGEGVFVAAIERALLDGTVDLAVHSAKDVPTDEHPELRIAAFLPRAVAEDVLVMPIGAVATDLGGLPRGARVGTDSPRRTAFLRALRPDLHVHPIHGNVDTRLRRLDTGETDGLVLAAAGLIRLGLASRITAVLPVTDVPPAPGQGALALQVRADDAVVTGLVARLDHAPTRRAVLAERALLAAAGGGCRAPLGALATCDGQRLHLVAGVAAPDGSIAVRAATKGGRGSGTDEDLVREVLQDLAAAASDAAAALGRPRVVVTRPRGDTAPSVLALVDRGLAPVCVPTIEVTAMPEAAVDGALEAIVQADWVVVTSRHAVEVLAAGASRTGRSLDRPLQAGAVVPRWAAVGPSVARALRAVGVVADVVPGVATSAALAEAIPSMVGARVLLACGDLADGHLSRRLTERGATVQSVIVYRTSEAPRSSLGTLPAALRPVPVAVLLTSGSTARGWLELATLLDATDLVRTIPCVAIGPTTAAEATRLGLWVMAQAGAPDPGTVADSVATAVRQVQERT